MRKPAAYWDSSALVCICVDQPPSAQARALLRRFEPAVWWGTLVEIHSGVCRLARDGDISYAARLRAESRLRLLSAGWREVPPSDRLRDSALQLLRTLPLRAADSLQLAASLDWCDHRPVGRPFICADRRLSEAAKVTGFRVMELASVAV